jgi:hypothetical protein
VLREKGFIITTGEGAACRGDLQQDEKRALQLCTNQSQSVQPGIFVQVLHFFSSIIGAPASTCPPPPGHHRWHINVQQINRLID